MHKKHDGRNYLRSCLLDEINAVQITLRLFKADPVARVLAEEISVNNSAASNHKYRGWSGGQLMKAVNLIIDALPGTSASVHA